MPYEPQYDGKTSNEDLLCTQILPANLEQWDEIIMAAQQERYSLQYEKWDVGNLKTLLPNGKQRRGNGRLICGDNRTEFALLDGKVKRIISCSKSSGNEL